MSGVAPRPPATNPAAFARRCVECLVRNRRAPEPPAEPLYGQRAACFVSIKSRGELRGCIGTLEPAEPDLGREIVRNARSSACDDPRFPPVGPEELPHLTYSVDVLSESEPCTVADLDPRVFGVIVTAGWRRGVLLPDLAGVDTVARQVAIACQKAGIAPGERFETRRFTVTRHREEGDHSGD